MNYYSIKIIVKGNDHYFINEFVRLHFCIKTK